MIGKQEWNEMALQVYDLEKRMKTTYEALAGQVSEPGLKAIFVKLSREEQQHANIIQAVSDKIARA